jgi:hypothetical protein
VADAVTRTALAESVHQVNVMRCDQALEHAVRHAHDFSVRACIECDLGILPACQAILSAEMPIRSKG